MRSAASSALVAGWHHGLAIVNLRGPGDNLAFVSGARRALGLGLPLEPCTTVADDGLRVVWAGPDDWFVVGPAGQAGAIAGRLRAEIADTHHAVTDVSSGYTVLCVAGPPARDVLAQGCPLDLHRRVFTLGMAAGSHYFKASIWLWQVDEAPAFELLVRRSFMAYCWLMLDRGTAECGMVVRHRDANVGATR